MENLPKKLSEQFLSTLDDTASKTEVVQLFDTLIKTLKEFKAEMEQNMALHKDGMGDMMKEHMDKMSATEERMMQAIKSNKELTYSESRTLMRLMREEVNKVRDDMPEMPDMEAEHKMMEERMVELEAKIPIIPPKFDPSNIFQELTNLVATVEELEKKIEELMKRPAGRFGSGGTSAMGVQFALGKMWKTETPSGAINSSNVTYTTTQDIHAVFQFAINGMSINDDEYTIAGRTITMDTAIDTALSGTSFRISYI